MIYEDPEIFVQCLRKKKTNSKSGYGKISTIKDMFDIKIAARNITEEEMKKCEEEFGDGRDNQGVVTEGEDNQGRKPEDDDEMLP